MHFIPSQTDAHLFSFILELPTIAASITGLSPVLEKMLFKLKGMPPEMMIPTDTAAFLGLLVLTAMKDYHLDPVFQELFDNAHHEPGWDYGAAFTQWRKSLPDDWLIQDVFLRLVAQSDPEMIRADSVCRTQNLSYPPRNVRLWPKQEVFNGGTLLELFEQAPVVAKEAFMGDSALQKRTMVLTALLEAFSLYLPGGFENALSPIHYCNEA